MHQIQPINISSKSAIFERKCITGSTFKASSTFGLSCPRVLPNSIGALSYIARWENWYATDSFGQERFDNGRYSIYFDSDTILGSQDYCKRSQMTIHGLAGVLFCENEQA